MSGGRDPRDILVAGAGAIGQFIGARLQQGGHLVTLLTRETHAAAIRKDGLQIHGATSLHGHVECITSPSQATRRYDAIVLTCKAHATAALAKDVAALLADDGVAVSLQNGFGNGAKLARFVPPSRVAVAITSHGVMVERPGVLVHAGVGGTFVGPLDAASTAAAERASSLLADAGLEPVSQADMRSAVWRKALVNHAVNPLAAIHGLSNGQVLDGSWWRTCHDLAQEGFAVARAAGVPLPDVSTPAGLVEVVRETLGRTRANRNSMVQDLAAQKPTEVEQISGRLVRLARRLGHPAFASEDIYHQLKDVEARYLGGATSLQMTKDEVAWETESF
ncbi:MAG: ketopantoate reductase family protein [bacterium]